MGPVAATDCPIIPNFNHSWLCGSLIEILHSVLGPRPQPPAGSLCEGLVKPKGGEEREGTEGALGALCLGPYYGRIA